jgi:hypothetical protein
MKGAIFMASNKILRYLFRLSNYFANLVTVKAHFLTLIREAVDMNKGFCVQISGIS